MKSDEIQPLIKQHFKIIDKLFHRIIVDFESGDILDFRKEIKKLRSLLHLLNMQFTTGYEFRITKKMKTFYGYAGIIRNLQLHLKNIRNYCEELSLDLPQVYVTKIEREIIYWKVNAKNFMSSDNNFYNDEELMLSELPNKITKSAIKKLLQYTFYELDVLLKHQDDDEVLHSIRKFMQDVAYNLSAVHYFAVPLPAFLNDEKNILSCIEQLESFRDKCIDLVLLKTYYDDAYGMNEKMLLKNIEHQWQEEKHAIRIKIYSSLQSLQLIHGNISSFLPDKQYMD